MKKIVFLLLLYLLKTQQSDIYNLVLLSQERGASCLDGSPPGFYINEGSSSNSKKFLIYFTGGGFCGSGSLADTLQSCYKRSSTSFGSTSKYKSETKFNKEGLLSPNQQINPVFYDWTKIYVIYCDGSEYLGHRQSPIQYKGKNLFFRGSRNVMQLFRYLDQKYDFYNGENIVITGVSAGGMASFQWSNYLYQKTKKAKVLAIPDSGFFITDYYSVVAQEKIIRIQAINLLTLINNYEQLPDPIQECLKKDNSKLDIVDCLNAANYIQFLKAPLFIIESAYDQWSILNILAVSCYTNPRYPYSLAECNDQYRKIIQDYRSSSIQYFYYMKNKAPTISLWSPSCVQHGFSHTESFYNDKYMVNGEKLAQSINQFIRNPNISKWLVDRQGWPSNRGCSGLPQFKDSKAEI